MVLPKKLDVSYRWVRPFKNILRVTISRFLTINAKWLQNEGTSQKKEVKKREKKGLLDI